MSHLMERLSNTERNLCPRCKLPGSGPYKRWVLNSRKKRYEPYYYFAHKRDGKLKWCYIPKRAVLDNRELAILTARPLLPEESNKVKITWPKQPFVPKFEET